MPLAVSIDNMVSSVRREVGFRERVYPRWITQGKLTAETASTELDRMRAVLEALEELRLARDFIHQLRRADMLWLEKDPHSLVAVPLSSEAGRSLRGAYDALDSHQAPLTTGTHAP